MSPDEYALLDQTKVLAYLSQICQRIVDRWTWRLDSWIWPSRFEVLRHNSRRFRLWHERWFRRWLRLTWSLWTEREASCWISNGSEELNRRHMAIVSWPVLRDVPSSLRSGVSLLGRLDLSILTTCWLLLSQDSNGGGFRSDYLLWWQNLLSSLELGETR